MTFSQSANAMRRLADEIDKVVAKIGDSQASKFTPQFTEGQAVGAAILLCYLRDLITASADNVVWDRPRILVLLHTIAEDNELFPCGVARILWQVEDEDEENQTSEPTDQS